MPSSKRLIIAIIALGLGLTLAYGCVQFVISQLAPLEPITNVSQDQRGAA